MLTGAIQDTLLVAMLRLAAEIEEIPQRVTRLVEQLSESRHRAVQAVSDYPLIITGSRLSRPEMCSISISVTEERQTRSNCEWSSVLFSACL